MFLNEKRDLGWYGAAALLGFVMVFAVIFYFEDRGEMIERQETWLSIEGKVSDKRYFTKTESRSRGARGGLRSVDVDIFEIILFYDDPSEVVTESTLTRRRIYAYVDVSEEIYLSTRNGDELTLLVNPDNLDFAILESDAERVLSGPSTSFVVGNSVAAILLLVFIGLGFRQQRRKRDFSTSV